MNDDVSMRRRPIGSVIGAVFGLVFVVVNGVRLPSPVAVAVVVVGVMAFVGALREVIVIGAVDTVAADVRAIRIYWTCVIGEVAAIPIGAVILNRVLHRSELVVVWVVFVVGVHFVPFARAFRLPLFGLLAWTLIAVAVIGGLTTVAVKDDIAASATAVVAGFVLIAFSAVGARRA